MAPLQVLSDDRSLLEPPLLTFVTRVFPEISNLQPVGTSTVPADK
jgi:hypothetical protein